MNRKLRRLQEKLDAKIERVADGISITPQGGIKGVVAEADYDENGDLKGYFVDFYDQHGNDVTKEIVQAATGSSNIAHSNDDIEKSKQISAVIELVIPKNSDGTDAPHFFHYIYVDEQITSTGHNLSGNLMDRINNMFDALATNEEMRKALKTAGELMLMGHYMSEHPLEFIDKDHPGDFEIVVKHSPHKF